MNQTTCYRCGSASLESGSVLNGDLPTLAFLPGKVRMRFWKFYLRRPVIQIAARICLDCGTIELTGDVAKVRALLGRPERAIEGSETGSKTPLHQMFDRW
jgi:hypothetical protein